MNDPPQAGPVPELDDLQPVFAGFFPKRTAAPPPPLAAVDVRDIAPVSECLSAGPAGWIERWSRNRHGCFDTERLAQSIAGEGDYDIYAYALLPVRGENGGVESFSVESIEGRIPDDYVFLGVDVASRSTSDFFECSPLSCNLAGVDVPVNQYCLLPDRAAGLRFLQEVAQDGGYESGPYFLVLVWKKQSTGRARREADHVSVGARSGCVRCQTFATLYGPPTQK